MSNSSHKKMAYILKTCFRKTCRGRRIILWIIVFVMVPFVYFEVTFPVRYMFRNSNVSSSCVIPRPDPYDPSVLQFVWTPKPLVCDDHHDIVYVDGGGLLQYNETAIKLLNLLQTNINCEYRSLHRDRDDVHVTFSNPVAFKPPHYIEFAVFHVACSDTTKGKLFDKLLSGIYPVKAAKDETAQQMSVIIFGIDSVSRSAAIRKLPKTLKYLKEELHSYDFRGHMKVGENTLPNLTPLLTGRRVWTPEVPITDYATEPFNKFPFLWKNFSKNGYATLYAEDEPHMATFNYLTRGFDDQPTDHYMRPYWLGIQQLNQLESKLSPVFLFLEHKNVNIQASSTMCYGNKPRHVIFTEYVKQFIRSYRGKRKFSFSHLVELCHEYPNFLEYGDETFLQLFTWMKTEGHLENTILVLLGDHGARIDKIRNTFVGRIEDRMPVLHIVLPEHLKLSYPEIDKNMRINTRRLSTNFDVHQTLIDVLSQNFEKPTKSYVDNSLRGISLFRQLPEDRSCADAWVPENYCACYTSSPLNKSTDIAQVLAAKMIESLNSRLAIEPKCSKLVLHTILDLQLITQGLKHVDTENAGISLLQFFQPEKQKNTRYEIVIETTPGQGAFEATFDVLDNSDLKFLGEIIRVNKYGDQSKCISQKILKPFCFCEN